MRIIPSIFPHPIGNLVIGDYPHRMSRKDATSLCQRNRKSFLCVEMQGEEMIVRACQDSYEAARRYWQEGRWIVFPVGYDGPSEMIYERS